MTPDIRYFQVAATVIPTLLVAIMISAKAFDLGVYPTEAASEEFVGKRATKAQRQEMLRSAETAWWLRAVILLVLALVMLSLTLVAERAALLALADNHPTTSRLHTVNRGLLGELGLFGIVVLVPALKTIREYAGRRPAFAYVIYLMLPVVLAFALSWRV